MSDAKRPTKRHLDRLRGSLRDLDERERRLQERLGDRVSGSSRSSDYRLAEALRAVLAYVDGEGQPLPGKTPIPSSPTGETNHG